MSNPSASDNGHAPVRCWSEWFERAARVFDDPRMKIAYYKDGQTGEPYSAEAVLATHQDIFLKLQPDTTHTVLDVGCGVGYFTNFFSGKVKTIVGADVSVSMIQAARAANPGGHFLVARADGLPFQPGLFDRVFSYGVTQYLPDEPTVSRVLDDMRRLLKSRGRILIGDILEPVHEPGEKTYRKPSPRGKRWWPDALNHDLSKLYLSRDFFVNYGRQHRLACEFFEQHIPGRSIPTPRYDVILKMEVE